METTIEPNKLPEWMKFIGDMPEVPSLIEQLLFTAGKRLQEKKEAIITYVLINKFELTATEDVYRRVTSVTFEDLPGVTSYYLDFKSKEEPGQFIVSFEDKIRTNQLEVEKEPSTPYKVEPYFLVEMPEGMEVPAL